MSESYEGPAGGLYDPNPLHQSVPDPLAEHERRLAEARALVAAADAQPTVAAAPYIPAQPGSSFYPPPAPHPGPVLPTSPPPASSPPAARVSEARAIFGGSATLQLKSGTKTLTYDFEALLVMEEDYGSLDAMQTEFKNLMADGMRGPILNRAVRLLHLGLLAYFEPGPDGRKALIRDMELSRIKEYVEIAGAAVSRSFGTGGVASSGGASEQSDPPSPSPGAGSTTSPSSPAASPPPPSGA